MLYLRFMPKKLQKLLKIRKIKKMKKAMERSRIKTSNDLGFFGVKRLTICCESHLISKEETGWLDGFWSSVAMNSGLDIATDIIAN